MRISGAGVSRKGKKVKPIKRMDWKSEFVKLGEALARAQDDLAKARDDAENFERHLRNNEIVLSNAQNEIKEIRATNKAIQASVDERIRIALKEQEHEMSRLTNRINSDAAHIEHKRVESEALKMVNSEFRALIIDALHGKGGAQMISPDFVLKE
jgi:chromosome segregation ATPase